MSDRTTAAQLRASLAEMTNRLAECSRSPVKYFDTRGGGVVFVTPDSYWESRMPNKLPHYMQSSPITKSGSKSYVPFFGQRRLMWREEINEADSKYRMELEQNWSLRPRAQENEANFRKDASEFDQLFADLRVHQAGMIRITPYIRCPRRLWDKRISSSGAAPP